jgi:hypothetical protein
MNSLTTMEWLQQSNRWLILVLSILLIMALLDIRILNAIYMILLQTARLLMNLVWRLLIVTGFVAGNTLEVAGELIGETGDVAEYTLGSVGKTLQTGVDRTSLAPSSFDLRPVGTGYSDTAKDMPIGGQVKWCVVGDSNARKGCMQMNVQDKCLSGRQYPTSEECLRAI